MAQSALTGRSDCVPVRIRSLQHRRLAWALAAALLAVGAGSLGAVELGNLYTAQVPWYPDEPDARENAYEAALRQILVRVTGSGEADRDPSLLALFEDPASLVIGFRTGANDTIWVSFDGDLIVRTLRQADRPVWSSDRPLTLVWLAIDAGARGRMILSASDRPPPRRNGARMDPDADLRERLESSANGRGLPLQFPLLDASDRETVTFSDIWGGFDQLILAASARYDAPSILIGRASVTNGQGPIRWIWHFAGEKREFSAGVEQAAGRIADAMAQRLAFAGLGDRSELRLEVFGLSSVEAYGRTLRLLSSLPQIETLNVERLAGDRFVFRLMTLGAPEQVARALESGGVLERETGSVIVREAASDPSGPMQPPQSAPPERQTAPAVAPVPVLQYRYAL